MITIRGKEYKFKLDSPATMKKLSEVQREGQAKREALLSMIDTDEDANLNDPQFIIDNWDVVMQLIDLCICGIDGILGAGEAGRILDFETSEDASVIELLQLEHEVAAAINGEVDTFEKASASMGLIAPVGPKGRLDEPVNERAAV